MTYPFKEEVEPQEMETIADLSENLVYLLPGCPDLMIRKTLQKVYRDFCRRSCCLRSTWRQLLVRGENKYMPVPVHGGVVETVARVSIDGKEVPETGYKVVMGRAPLVVLDERFVLPQDYPEDAYVSTIAIDIVEIPKLGSEQCPSWFFDRYAEAITSGVLANLKMMSNMPWADAQHGQTARIEYENAINETRIRYHSNDNGNLDLLDTGGLI